MQVSPMIERDEDGTLAVRMTEARCSASPFRSMPHERPDTVFMLVGLDNGSFHWLASPEEARAFARALTEVADQIRQPEAA